MNMSVSKSPRQSVVEEVSRTRHVFDSYRANLAWGFANSILAIFLYIELMYGSFINYITETLPYLYLWHLAVGIEVLLLLNVAYHFVSYIRGQSIKPIEMTPIHKRLCRIAENEPGFCQSPIAKSSCANKLDVSKGFLATPVFSPSSYVPVLQRSNTQDSGRDGSFYNSYGVNSFNKSPVNRSEDDCGLNVSLNSSFKSVSPRELIESESSLKSFIQQQSENQLRLRKMEGTFRSIQPQWCNYDTTMEGFPLRSQYYLACSPQLPAHHVDSPQDSSNYSPSETDVWSKLNISQDKVDLWTERLRKYLGQTILSKLSETIASVNKSLTSAGFEDVQIGAVNLSTLKNISSSKFHIVPQLPDLIPYLEASTNQEYLVQRINELSSGGCISSFRWSSGGEFRGKKWEENLPTDSAILMHCLCCYLDSRLPPHPKYSDGKTFTNQHFFRAIDKPVISDLKDSVYFHETSTNPPHYDVITDAAVMHVKKGRLNLFHSILLFFYFIKTKEHGMLRRVSLGLSGINILWIFDE